MSNNPLRKILIFASAPIVLILIVVIVILTRQPKGPTEAIASTTKRVEVKEAWLGEIRDVLELSGTIEPNSQVTVFPEIPGTIITMSVEEGNQVQKGQTLAVIEHEKFELQMTQAEAAYRAAQTASEQAQKLARINVESQIAQARAQLAGADSAHQQVLDLAETRTTLQIEQAEAALASLQANLEKIISGAREEDRKQAQAAVDQAQANLANAKSNTARVKKLFDSGAMSIQSFEGAQTQLDIAQAQYDMAVEQRKLIEKGAREEDIDAMKAQVRQAEAALKLARTQAETKTWEKDIALAESQVEAARAAFKAAEALADAKSWEAEIIAAKTNATQAKAAFDLAKRQVEDATITAPITGVVSRRHLDLGGKAAPVAPLFELVDIKTVKAVVSVMEADLSKLKLKDKAEIHVEALKEEKKDGTIHGEVSLVSPVLERAKRAAKVEITIDNAKMNLKPGMFAKVTIPVEVHDNAILIPRSAVIEGSQKDSGTVFVVENEKSKRREVKLGLSLEDVIEITNGLTAGELVVAAGQHSLKDDEEVTAVKPIK